MYSNSPNLPTFVLRFSKHDLRVLHDALSIPAVYKCPNGTVAGGLEALLILLRRLTYPNRLSDLCQLFGRPEPELSMIIHEVTLFFGGGGGGGSALIWVNKWPYPISLSAFFRHVGHNKQF